jgi:hypothetical protein
LTGTTFFFAEICAKPVELIKEAIPAPGWPFSSILPIPPTVLLYRRTRKRFFVTAITRRMQCPR